MRRRSHQQLDRKRVALILAVTAAILPASTAAQTVVGTVVEEGTLRPIGGAFVVLEGPDGTREGGVLAGDEGRFVLRAPGPGTYRLVAQLIGYADAVSESFTLSAGESLRRTVEVSVRAVSLEGIRAEVGKRCRTRPGTGPETARVWAEARKALEITDWTERQGALQLHIVEHKRELDARSFRVTAIRERGRRGWYDRSPYRSLPADSLGTVGYIQLDDDGLWSYWGPDADVLLSESFLDTHCFRVAESPEQQGAVGLAFEPVPGRSLPDIQGVLWLDRTTAELQTLEYTYVNSPPVMGDWDQVGGRVEFQRLATGMWIISRWRIRMPLEAVHVGGYGIDRAQQRSLVSLVEDGAEVISVRTASGDVLARAAGATLYGAVEDSATGMPLEGATVALAATGRQATTGPDGTFRLSDVPAGTFVARVSHPDLELLGAGPVERLVTLERGRAVRLNIRPSLDGQAARFCARAGAYRDAAVIFGHVRAPDGETGVPGALVRFFTGGVEERVVSDSTGGFAVCFERRDSVAVAAVGPADTFRGREALDTRTVVLEAPLTRQDLTLHPSALADRAAPGAAARGRWSNALIGTVIRADTRAPIGGVMVLVRDPDGRPIHSSVTNDDGQFRFQHPDQATRQFEITIEHVAYGKVSQVVDFAPGEQLDVEVVLTERAIELDPIVVTQRRRGLLVDVGFYDRVEQGAGLFVEREEIERRNPSQITDLLQGKPGITVMQTGAMARDIRVVAPVRFGGDCQPALWLDGILVRSGGTPRTSGINDLPAQPQLSELVSPDDVEAIEIYRSPAGMPSEYRGSDASCGVVLIWTRRGGVAP